MPGYVYRVQVLIKSIFMVYTEQMVRVSCSLYDMFYTDAKCYIIMCKLVKLAFCLCLFVFVVNR